MPGMEASEGTVTERGKGRVFYGLFGEGLGSVGLKR